MARRTRRAAISVCVLLAILLLALWLGNRLVLIHESASPDRFDLGTVAAGSRLELSCRLLTSANKHPLDALYQALLRRTPATWQSALEKLDPARFRKKAPQMDLSALKPEVQLPGFVHLEKIDPRQYKYWFDNRPFFVLYLTIDTSRPADYFGRVKLRLADREASLPIRLTVTSSEPGTGRVLIVETPYSSDTTEHGSDLDPATKVLSSLNTRVDCVHELPNQLEIYETILLAGGPLAILKDEDASRLQTFVTNGGRLVIACDAFFDGTVPNANRIVAGFGLHVVNRDYAKTVTVTNIVPDVVTSGVRHLDFWRPALIQVTDLNKARILAWAPTLDGGFVADARLAGAGHLILLTQSLWWYRLTTARTTSDNACLLRNMLTPERH